eukprot:12864539-Alexandrium_andersonii.AAC.1
MPADLCSVPSLRSSLPGTAPAELSRPLLRTPARESTGVRPLGCLAAKGSRARKAGRLRDLASRGSGSP